MKTAKERVNEYNVLYYETLEDKVVGREYFHEILVKQIQLEWMKEGARRAAIICIAEPNTTGDKAHHSILSIAEQWTEKDL